ncbi:hypothetical protein [Enterococcus phage vB_Efs6_KEN03]
MNIANIDRGAYTPVEVEVGSSLINIKTGNSLITFNRSETEQLIQALQQALEEIPEEPKYVVVFPQKESDYKDWEYFYLHPSGTILYSDYPSNVCDKGVMTLDEIKAVGKHYEPFAIPAEEFKENHLGEF